MHVDNPSALICILWFVIKKWNFNNKLQLLKRQLPTSILKYVRNELFESHGKHGKYGNK